MGDEQEGMIPCSWQAKGKADLGFSVKEITETYSTGLVKRRRVFKHGAKLDDTGEDAIAWEIQVIFFNGNRDPSAADAPDAQYPDAVDAFTLSLRVHETGDLTLSTRGPVRARLQSYRRVDSHAFRNGCTLVLNFIQDSEDDIDTASFSAPYAGSVASSVAELAGEFNEEAGTGASFMSSLKDLAAQLEGLAQAPADFVDSLEATANAIVGTCATVERSFADTRNKAGGEMAKLLTDPTKSAALRSLRKLSDLARTAVKDAAEAGAVSTRVITKSYRTELSIFDIATMELQSPAVLLSMNGGIADVLAIPPGTPIKMRSLA
jgi:prophage DNA circulation protein